MAKTSLSRPARSKANVKKSVPPASNAQAMTPPFFRVGLFFSGICFIAALLNFAAQAVFRHQLAPGEFGIMNATLGLVGLLALPMTALNQTVTYQLARQDAEGDVAGLGRLRVAARGLLEMASLFSALLALLLLFFLFWVFNVPRFTLHLYALILVLLALGGTLSSALSYGLNRFSFWGGLVLVSAFLRFILALVLTPLSPGAETALGIFVLTGLISLWPLLSFRADEAVRWRESLRLFVARPFLLHFSAAFSVALGLFCFTFSDQLVAQKWFGPQPEGAPGAALIPFREYDAYQAAGVLGRALIWGTQPLLLVFYTQRSRRDALQGKGFRLTTLKTWAGHYRLIFLYLGALAGGALFLGLARVPLSTLFTGRADPETASYLGRFALAMLPIGVLQVFGTYFLAARRLADSYRLGGLGCLYAILLYLGGRQPDLLLTYMFGGAMLSLFFLLFSMIVAWSRRQP